MMDIGKVAAYIALAAMFLFGLLVGCQHGRMAVAQIEAEWNKERLAVIKAETGASESARAEEQRIGKNINATANHYLQEKARAETVESAVVAGLRNDTLRLRKHWSACETHRLSQAAASAAELDAAARLREAGAASLVRVAAECDAHVAGLQKALTAERQDGRD